MTPQAPSATFRRCIVLLVLSVFIEQAEQFQSPFIRSAGRRRAVDTFFQRQFRQANFNWLSMATTSVEQSSSLSENGSASEESSSIQSSSVSEEQNLLNERIAELCRSGLVEEAIILLEGQLQVERSGDVCEQFPNETSFTTIMCALVTRNDDSISNLLEQLEDLLERMKSLSTAGRVECTPTIAAYNILVLAWSKSFLGDAGIRCDELLSELWERYNKTQDMRFLPLKSTYVSTLTALARSGRGKEAAQLAEERLEEMERLRLDHPTVAPSTICFNVVL
jgi:hypothetical protein